MSQITPVGAGDGFLHPNFIICKLVPSTSRPGRTEKMPCDRAGNVVSLHVADRMTHADAITAASAAGEMYRPAVIINGDGRFCIDIDDCLTGGAWSPLAVELCNTFPGCYVEVSQSGGGLHIFGRTSSIPDHVNKNIPLHIELYTDNRFICLGQSGSGDMLCESGAALNTVVSRYFPYTEPSRVAEWTTTHHATACPIDDDTRLIEKALAGKASAASVFGGGKATFADLWNCNVASLADAYPDPSRDFDRNCADSALATRLLWWTGGNCERTEKLMRQSALNREKWDKHKTYVSRTILNAAGLLTSYYSVGAPIELVKPTHDAPVMRSGFQFMGVSQLLEHFAGCVYVAENHRVLTPNGQMLKSEQFNALYGGYVFTLDDTNTKDTRKAWEAFTESQCVSFPKVDRASFRPDLPQGAIVDEDGLRVVNSYVPVTVPSVPGDVTPFLNHLAKSLPVERDRTILLSFMAACVQYPGKKFKWAPLIQGVEGNGKTFFTLCVMMAIGERYTHMPPAQEIGEKFNSWLFDKIFIGVEDIYVPEQKLELIETLKPMITGERLAKRAMNTDQSMHRLCANFIFNSNHKNAVRKTANDRRFAIFYTAQQAESDLVRDGMVGQYFPTLYDWARNGGYAHITHYLQNYTILDEFNPVTGCQRAPETSSTHEAVAASLGSVEQEVLEAIDEGRPGFRGGWVSSKALDGLLNHLRAGGRVPPAKRREMMQSLGYDWHPALHNGRVNNPILIDGGSKPRLYIKYGHIHCNLATPVEVARQYEIAQGDVTAMVMMGSK